MRVLIVEDDPATRRMLEKLFASEGYQVTACPDGETALDCHARDPFSFVALDLGLPGIDGFEVVRRIRALPDGDAVYILVITSGTESGELQETLAVGGNDYLAKPVSPSSLGVRLAVAKRQIGEIAKRRQLEQQNAAARAYVRDLILSIPDMLFVLDADGRIHEINQPALDKLGFTEEELIGQRVDSVLGLLEGWSPRSVAGSEPLPDIEAILRTREGREVPVLLSGSRIRGTGHL